MATVAAINVALNANTAGYNSAMNTAGQNTARFAAQAKSGSGQVGQSLQAAAYAFQDFTSVLESGGKNALGRAFGSISNNIGMITAGFGPWGMLAGTVGGVIAQLVIPRLLATNEAVDDGKTKMEELAKKAEEAAERMAKAWDDVREKQAAALQFSEKLFDPTQSTESIADIVEQQKAERVKLEANLKSVIAEGQGIFNRLSQEGKTGLTTVGAFSTGIENVSVGGLRVATQEKYQYSDDEMEAIYTRDGAHTALGRGLYDLTHSKIGTRTAMVGVDEDTAKRLRAAQEEIAKAKELMAINDRQIAQAKEQKAILMAGDAAVAADEQSKAVAEAVKHHNALLAKISKDQEKSFKDAVKHHADLMAADEVNKRESLEARVLARYNAESSSTRPGIASAEFNSASAYSAIAEATRGKDKPQLDKLIDVEVKAAAQARLDAKRVEDAVIKAKPPVADF